MDLKVGTWQYLSLHLIEEYITGFTYSYYSKRERVWLQTDKETLLFGMDVGLSNPGCVTVKRLGQGATQVQKRTATSSSREEQRANSTPNNSRSGQAGVTGAALCRSGSCRKYIPE